jgi:hypothetical protein
VPVKGVGVQVPPRTRQNRPLTRENRSEALAFSSQGLHAQIRSASRLLTWVEQQHDSTISDLAQGDLEHYLAAHPGVRCSGRSFVIWLGTAGRTRALRPAPTGTAAAGHRDRRSLLAQHRAPAPRHHHQQPQPCRRPVPGAVRLVPEQVLRMTLGQARRTRLEPLRRQPRGQRLRSIRATTPAGGSPGNWITDCAAYRGPCGSPARRPRPGPSRLTAES